MPFLVAIGKWLGTFVVDKLLRIVYEAVMEYIKTKKENAEIKKQLGEKVKEIMADPDPVARAKRMKDLLGT